MISDDDEVNNKVLSKTSYKVNLNYFKNFVYWEKNLPMRMGPNCFIIVMEWRFYNRYLNGTSP